MASNRKQIHFPLHRSRSFDHFMDNYCSEELKTINTDIITKGLSKDELFEIIEKYTKWKDDHKGTVRYIICQYLGWSIPSKASMMVLKEFVGCNKVLEIGAGLGLWSALMKEFGLDVITTSKEPNSMPYKKEQPDHGWCDIELLDGLDAVRKYDECNVLFISWGYHNKEFKQAVNQFKGNKIVVVGEIGGCTYWLNTDKYNNKYKMVKWFGIPQWYGLNDAMFFYERK